MKCRDIKLHDSKFLKGNIERELYIREQISDHILSGRLDPEELSEHGGYGAGALSACDIRNPGEAVGGMAEPVITGGAVPADPVYDDSGSGDQGADSETGEELHGLSSEAERSNPNEAGEVYLTGWEGQREIYFRDFCLDRKEQIGRASCRERV